MLVNLIWVTSDINSYPHRRVVGMLADDLQPATPRKLIQIERRTNALCELLMGSDFDCNVASKTIRFEIEVDD